MIILLSSFRKSEHGNIYLIILINCQRYDVYIINISRISCTIILDKEIILYYQYIVSVTVCFIDGFYLTQISG